jgi:hypothetical protein
MRGVLRCMYVYPDQVITMNSDGTSPCTSVYVVRCMWASVAVPYRRWVMSAPILEVTMLEMLIRRVKAPEWDGWMHGSLLSQGKRGTGRLVLGLVF